MVKKNLSAILSIELYDRRMTPCLKRSDKGDAVVGRLVFVWIENAKLPQEDVYKAFVEEEFKKRLRSYRCRGRVWRGAQILIWLSIALLGLLGSVLATTDTASIFAILAGAGVAILTTFTQAAHPGRQADAHEDARLLMRDEAWALLSGIYPYEKAGDKEDREPLTPEEAFMLFIKRVRTIVKSKRDATRISDLS
jgi:hypothetical protein